MHIQSAGIVSAMMIHDNYYLYFYSDISRYVLIVILTNKDTIISDL